MNIQRYILPASIAATLHVAFMLGFNEKSGLVRQIIEVPLRDPPVAKPAEDPIIPPPEEKTATTEPVQPLGGGPAPPVIDPPLARPKTDPISMTEDENRQTKKDIKLDVVPKTFGPGEIGVNGPVKWKGPAIGVGHLDRIPRATVQISPEYPAKLHHDGITGSVTVEFEVNTEGRVVRAEAVNYTHRELAEPAVRAVRKWHFEPGRRHGHLVPFRMAIPMEFSLAAD